MYSNVAYLGTVNEEIARNDTRLLVSAVGHYITDDIGIVTERPSGRSDYQLLYIARGKLRVILCGSEKIIKKGTMLLFRPGETQTYYSPDGEQTETYWVHFTGCDVESILDSYGLVRGENLFFAGTAPDYKWLYSQMIRELQLRRKDYDKLLSIMLCHVLLMLGRHIAEGMNNDGDLIDEMESAIHYFNENYNKDISIDEYAKKRHMSTCWFIRSFRRLTKKTPMKYIMELRLANAMTLLENTSYSVNRISSLVGYDNALYFSRLFKKQTGISPTEYRKKER